MTAEADILMDVERTIKRALNSERPGEVISSLIGPAELSDKEKRQRRHGQLQDAIQKIYLAAMHKCLARAEIQMLRKLHKGIARVKNTQPVAADFLFDLDDFEKGFFWEMREAGEEALEISGQGLLSELGIDRKYVTPHGIIHDFTIARENRLAAVPSEIYETMKVSLTEGIQRGETMDELGERVREVIGQIDAGRAQTIARTETASAYNTGRMEGMRQHGITHKSWLTAHDERVRQSHFLAEKEGAIPIDQNFANGLAMPGDPSGPPQEVINCRCTLEAARGAPAGELRAFGGARGEENDV